MEQYPPPPVPPAWWYSSSNPLTAIGVAQMTVESGPALPSRSTAATAIATGTSVVKPSMMPPVDVLPAPPQRYLLARLALSTEPGTKSKPPQFPALLGASDTTHASAEVVMGDVEAASTALP